MPALHPEIDPDGLLEFSVVFTDRSLNHMSKTFQKVMTDIHDTLCEVYGADAAVVVPGGGTYAMEAVARQLAGGEDVLVIRNGFFSFRWSQILEAGDIAASQTVLKARRVGNEPTAAFAPVPIEEAVAKIRDLKPAVVFAPHVETASGMILPDGYISALAQAVHEYGGLMVLDCIASGCAWVDMKATGVDVLISAPQKGWSAQPSAGLVMLNARATELVKSRSSSSFAVDLGKWLTIMEAYTGGAHAYHATMPTDALRALRDVMLEAKDYGFVKLSEAQWELGRRVRSVLKARGFASVAADAVAAPGVVVCYTADPALKSGAAFAAQGVQIAAGVPLQCDEGEGFSTFRLGLFGLDKLYDVDATVARLEAALDAVTS